MERGGLVAGDSFPEDLGVSSDSTILRVSECLGRRSDQKNPRKAQSIDIEIQCQINPPSHSYRIIEISSVFLCKTFIIPSAAEHFGKPKTRPIQTQAF